MKINPALANDVAAAFAQYNAACVAAGLMPICEEDASVLLDAEELPTAWLDDQRARICSTRDQCDALDILAEAVQRRSDFISDPGNVS